jgi:hypothetical protein
MKLALPGNPCHDKTDLVRYAYGDLSIIRSVVVRLHLLACPVCRRNLQHIAGVSAVLSDAFAERPQRPSRPNPVKLPRWFPSKIALGFGIAATLAGATYLAVQAVVHPEASPFNFYRHNLVPTADPCASQNATGSPNAPDPNAARPSAANLVDPEKKILSPAEGRAARAALDPKTRRLGGLKPYPQD